METDLWSVKSASLNTFRPVKKLLPLLVRYVHNDYVYFDSTLVEEGQMCIDKDKLGKKFKKDV